MTSREFNQDTGRAKRAAETGPVYITDRGRPAHVLLSIEEYDRLVAARTAIDLLGEPIGVEEIELVYERSTDLARPAAFE